MPSLSNSLPELANLSDLASLLKLSEFELKLFSLRTEQFYSTFERPKSSGKGVRIICAPDNKLKAIQRRIKTYLLDCIDAHPASTGYGRGCSIVKNASVHVAQNVVLNLDIENFFSSISISRVVGLFITLGYSEGVAFHLARLCCYKHALPQGAPTSPAIANLVCHRLDRRLTGLAANKNLKYTRYCDDISVSSSEHMTPGLVALIKTIVAEEGFQINKDKTRILSRRSCQIVTGLTVNEKVNVPRRKRRELRAAFHQAANASQGAINEQEKHRLQGLASFVQMVQKGLVQPKLGRLSRIIEE